MTKYQLSEHKGFTVLEVLIAMIILSVGLLGTAGMLLGTINSNKVSQDMSIAAVLAKAKIEELRRLSYLQLQSSASSETEDPVTDYPRFKRVSTLNNVSGTSRVYDATVTVSWGWKGIHHVAQKTILAGE